MKRGQIYIIIAETQAKFGETKKKKKNSQDIDQVTNHKNKRLRHKYIGSY